MSYPKNRKSFTVEAESLPKLPTGIEGLDEVLHGGLPAGRLTVIVGGTGAGKTVLSTELLIRGTEVDRAAVYVSFEESCKAMRQNALSMGWDLEQIENEGELALICPEIDYEAITAGEYSIEGLCAILEGVIQKVDAQMVVIDALDMLLRLFEDPDEARNQLITLHRWLDKQELTSIMTLKETESPARPYEYMDFMAGCVLKLDERIQDQITTRRLKVGKYRGSDFASREHPFVITGSGIVVMPLFMVELVEKATGEFVKTINKDIDEILGGGYRRGSSILISGPSGSGKTTLAFTITLEAARQGERVLYLSLEESAQTLVSEMKSVGFYNESLLEEGNLRISAVSPEAMGMEEHLYRILKEIEEYQPDHLVLDAISATNRIGSEQASREFLVRLYHATKQRGITCIFTNQTITPLDEHVTLSGLGISSLVDTAVLVNYTRDAQTIGRKLLVLKSRGTNHSTQYHRFRITNDGVVIEKNR